MKMTVGLPEDYLRSLVRIDPAMLAWFTLTDRETLDHESEQRLFKLIHDPNYREFSLDASFYSIKEHILERIFKKFYTAFPSILQLESIKDNLEDDRITCEALLIPIVINTIIKQIKTEKDENKQLTQILNIRITKKLLNQLETSEIQEQLTQGLLTLGFEKLGTRSENYLSLIKQISLDPNASAEKAKIVISNKSSPDIENLKKQHLADKEAVQILTSLQKINLEDNPKKPTSEHADPDDPIQKLDRISNLELTY